MGLFWDRPSGAQASAVRRRQRRNRRTRRYSIPVVEAGDPHWSIITCGRLLRHGSYRPPHKHLRR